MEVSSVHQSPFFPMIQTVYGHYSDSTDLEFVISIHTCLLLLNPVSQEPLKIFMYTICPHFPLFLSFIFLSRSQFI